MKKVGRNQEVFSITRFSLDISGPDTDNWELGTHLWLSAKSESCSNFLLRQETCGAEGNADFLREKKLDTNCSVSGLLHLPSGNLT